MRKEIHLRPSDVPSHLLAGYKGRRLKLCITEDISINSHDAYWSGGSRTTWYVQRLSDGAKLPLLDTTHHPMRVRVEDKRMEIKPGYIIVAHSIFQGEDMGLTFHIHPLNVAPLFSVPSTNLSIEERFVLTAARTLKSSYNGRSRRDMALDHPFSLGHAFKDLRITKEEYQVAYDSLVEKGLLNKRGAITVEGRNAL